jgi:hypothetical protein
LIRKIPSLNSKYKFWLTVFLSVCGVFYSLSAQEHFNFNYTDRSSLLLDNWDFIARSPLGVPRNTEQSTGAVVSYDQQVHPGVLRIPVDIGDLWEGINSTRNTLFRDLPSDWTSIRLKIAFFDPVQGNQQATLVAYQDDDNYVQISRTFEVFNRIMFTSEADGKAINLNSVDESSTANLYLRLDRYPDTQNITSYYSLDGIGWTEVGNVVRTLSNTRLAIEVGASPGGFPNADIAWAEVSVQPLPATDELRASPGSIVFNAIKGEQTDGTRSIFVYSALEKRIGWKQSADVPWLTADLQNGVTDGILKIGVNINGLDPGIYNGNVHLESAQSVSGQVIIPVSLIVNPDVPVKVATWKEGKAAAMSVSVDDGQPSGFDELFNNGFKGTYVTNGTSPPAFYTAYYNAGMELGSHLVNHPCNSVSDDVLKSQEILPNVLNLCTYTPVTLEKVITLVWPCGYTNFREQAAASGYFLSARGYNINKLEDATPDNFMNLKSYNSHEHTPFPPSDLKTVVDSAILGGKWFNLVLHNLTNDDGAINYAHGKNIWVASIGSVIKYILQRDRFVLNGYNKSPDNIEFNVSRLPVPSSPSRNFEESFDVNDQVTMLIDIDDNRLVETVLADGISNPFRNEKSNGNIILSTNIKLEPSVNKSVAIHYRSEPAVPIDLNTNILNFNTIVNRNPDSQPLFILTQTDDPEMWSATVAGSGQNWRVSITPNSGYLNDTAMISVNSSGLPAGNYKKIINLSSPKGNFYPVEIEVYLTVNPNILHQNYPNPFNAYTWIEYDLPEDGPVSLEIYNSQGRKCYTFPDKYMISGNYKFKWDTRSFPAGIYLLKIKTKTFSETAKMMLMK